jgi:hypothetical protein
MALASLLSLSACEEKDGADPAVNLSFSAAEFLLQDLDALAKPYLRDGCDKKVFSIGTVASVRAERQSLSYILPQLQLQSSQATRIREYARTHHQATAPHLGNITVIHEQILARGNSERDGYVQAFNQGKLTQEQFDDKLKQLFDRVTDELHSHTQKQTHLQVLHSERAVLLQSVEKVLEPAQLSQWNHWRLNYAN